MLSLTKAQVNVVLNNGEQSLLIPSDAWPNDFFVLSKHWVQKNNKPVQNLVIMWSKIPRWLKSLCNRTAIFSYGVKINSRLRIMDNQERIKSKSKFLRVFTFNLFFSLELNNSTSGITFWLTKPGWSKFV